MESLLIRFLKIWGVYGVILSVLVKLLAIIENNGVSNQNSYVQL